MSFKDLEKYLDGLSGTENIPACDCIVYHGHEVVFRHSAGYSDLEKTKPVSDKDRYILYSATKVLTATAAMQLVEQGKMSLSDPVCRYLPEFETMYVGKEKAKNLITVEHLLTMRGGLDYDMAAPAIKAVIEKDPNASTAQIVEAIAKKPLTFEPGTRFQYSLCHDVLARVIEVVSGQKFSDYMKENIFEPVGMVSSGFSIEAAKGMLSQQYIGDPETKELTPIGDVNFSVPTPCYESGGAGLVSTVDDYGRFVETMCNYGVTASGRRILKKETIDLMRTNRMDEVCQKDFDKCIKRGYGYGLGVRTLIEKEKSGAKSPIGEFGWDGAAGAYVMMDVENQIGIFYAQQVIGRDVSPIIHTRIRNMVYESMAPEIYGEGCDFLLELGEERKNTEIRLLQLTDMQIIDASQQRRPNRIRPDEVAAWMPENVDQQCYNHIRSLVAQTRPDLIFITGDVTYGEFDDSGRVIQDFIRFMDSLEIPWTLCFGNHDNESAIGVAKQCELYSKGKNCLFKRGTVSGNSNFSIGITCGGVLKRVLYMLDTNGCYRPDDPDIIVKAGLYPDQIEEMQKKAALLEKKNGKKVPGFMAFHIPTDGFVKAEQAKGYCTEEDPFYVLGVDKKPQDGDFGFKFERVRPIEMGEDFMDVLYQCGIDGLFTGHYHEITTCITYEGIKWVYGLKTGQYDYHAPGQLGGTLITLEAGKDEFKVQHVPSLYPHKMLPEKAPVYKDFFAKGEQ